MKIRHCARVILLNQNSEILLLYADDPSTTTAEGVYNGPFWFLVGGEIEGGETLEEAALREIYEETGLARDKITLGPLVWHGEVTLVLNKELTQLRQQFIVARTTDVNVSLHNATPFEKSVIKTMAWFSLDAIARCPDIIYPLCLASLLPPILADTYPAEPQFIDVAENPVHKKSGA